MFLSAGSGSFIDVTSDDPLREGKWVDVVVTYQGSSSADSSGDSTLRLYIDGEVSGTAVVPGSVVRAKKSCTRQELVSVESPVRVQIVAC